MTIEAVSAGTAAAAAGEEQLTVRLVSDPSSLTPAEKATLNADVADLTYRAVRGDDASEWEAIAAGWRAYYAEAGNRAEDYARLGLVYDGPRLIQFSGFMVVRTPPECTLLWYHAAVTDPEYQGRGVFAKARDLLADPVWLASHPRPTYLVFRTPNPVIYETARKAAQRYPDWYAQFHPKIRGDGTIEPVPEEVKDVATRIAMALSPTCTYLRDTFVVRDFLGKFGEDIYRQTPPPSDSAGTNAYFAANLEAARQDALMCVALLLP
jgi:GNAT superfamily N-acetyltransferase